MRIKTITEVKPRRVYAVTTTTGTFVADGMAHHNCVACNLYQKGKPDVFAVNLIQEKVDIVTLQQSRYQILKVDSIWYQEQIEKYTNLIANRL